MKKVLRIIRTIFAALLAVLAVGMMIFTIVSVMTVNQTQRSILGVSACVVLSDSMKKTDFKAGDLVVIKAVDCKTLQNGDIISFISHNQSNEGAIFTHKIRSLTTDANGQPGFITYGTTTDTNDESIVLYDDVVGKYCFSIPGAGNFFNFLKTTPGYVTCILIPFLILILMQAIHSIRLFRRYKAQQTEELVNEKKQLQDEREQAKAMMEELQKLRDQVNVKKDNEAETVIEVDEKDKVDSQNKE